MSKASDPQEKGKIRTLKLCIACTTFRRRANATCSTPYKEESHIWINTTSAQNDCEFCHRSQFVNTVRLFPLSTLSNIWTPKVGMQLIGRSIRAITLRVFFLDACKTAWHCLQLHRVVMKNETCDWNVEDTSKGRVNIYKYWRIIDKCGLLSDEPSWKLACLCIPTYIRILIRSNNSGPRSEENRSSSPGSQYAFCILCVRGTMTKHLRYSQALIYLKAPWVRP